MLPSPATASRYIALAGPTASGKTAAALAIALHMPVEIVSVDSALVYRGMDIGTAKPTAAERAQVPHHLIDILDPRDSYSAAAFVADATRLIDEIAARGRTPLLVGGTMLYFKALADGIIADRKKARRPDIVDHHRIGTLEHIGGTQGHPARQADQGRIVHPDDRHAFKVAFLGSYRSRSAQMRNRPFHPRHRPHPIERGGRHRQMDVRRAADRIHDPDIRRRNIVDATGAAFDQVDKDRQLLRD